MSCWKGWLMGGGVCAALLAAVPVAHSAQINCNVLVDGTSVGVCAISTTGAANFTLTSNPLFSNISLNATGVPLVATPDLSTVTLDVSSATGFTGSHNLELDIFQSGITAPAGEKVSSTFTVNNLIGTPGPSHLQDFFNGTSSSLGLLLNGATFPAGTTNATVGPDINTIGPAITADAEQFVITFTAGGQSANDTIELVGVAPAVPEPMSLVLLGTALAGMGLALRRRRN